MERKAIVIKMGGNKDMSNALALAAVSPELMALKIENDELRRQRDEERQKRWRRNAQKIAHYWNNIYKPVPWWEPVVAAVWTALCSFVRLFVVKDEV